MHNFSLPNKWVCIKLAWMNAGRLQDCRNLAIVSMMNVVSFYGGKVPESVLLELPIA